MASDQLEIGGKQFQMSAGGAVFVKANGHWKTASEADARMVREAISLLSGR
jgi:hypothetical protein